MRSTTRALSIAGAFVVLAGACGSDGDAAPEPTATVVATATAAPTAPPTPTAPAIEETALEPPATVATFGGVEFRLTRAVLSNQDPASRSSGGRILSPSTWLYLDIGVESRLVNGDLGINDRTFAGLRIGDAFAEGQVFSRDISPRTVVRAGVSGTYEVFYEVPDDFVFEDAALVLGAPTSEPVVLRFDGRPSPADAPQPLAVTLTGEVDGREVCGPTRLAVEVIEAVTALDLPADIADTGGLPRRALVDHVFLEVTVAFTVVGAPESGGVAGAGGCVGTIVSDELVALTVDGEPARSRYVEGERGFEAQVGETASLTVGFLVPRRAAIELVLGSAGGLTTAAVVPIAG